jgi:hypothetical protein
VVGIDRRGIQEAVEELAYPCYQRRHGVPHREIGGEGGCEVLCPASFQALPSNPRQYQTSAKRCSGLRISLDKDMRYVFDSRSKSSVSLHQKPLPNGRELTLTFVTQSTLVTMFSSLI